MIELQYAINGLLIAILMIDIARNWRGRQLDARLKRVEEFLRFAKRPP